MAGKGGGATGVAPPIETGAYLARNSARMPRPSASAIPMMAWTRILPEAPGLRPTARRPWADETDADGGAEETERAGDVALEFSDEGDHGGGVFLLLEVRRAHAGTLPTGNSQWEASAAWLVVVVIVVVAVVADEADVDGAQEGEHEGLDEADEQLHEVEDEKEAGAVEQVFTTEDVAEKTDRKGEGADADGEHLDEADEDEHKREDRVEPAGGFVLVGLVAEEVPENHLRAGDLEDDDQPRRRRRSGRGRSCR
jgi:hypothetical protein